MASIQLGSSYELDIQQGNLILNHVDPAGVKALLAEVGAPEILQLIIADVSNPAVKEALELALQALIAMTA